MISLYKFLLAKVMPKLYLIFVLMLNNVTNTVSIIGCGWLGLPLAKFLLAKGFVIKGSTTHTEKLDTLRNNGINPFLVHLNPTLSGNNVPLFFNADILIINIPPGRKLLNHHYAATINYLNNAVRLSTIKKIIFISSTSVYPETNNWVDEDTPIDANSASALDMFAAEQVFTSNPNLHTTVIRMAGLVGPSRHPGRFFGGKNNIPNGLVPVNLIHLQDCVGLISAVIENNFWNKIINGVAPSHPTKQQFYGLASLKYNGSKASFIPEKGQHKIVSSKVTSTQLGYEFKITDLMEWVHTAEAI
jgi:nucleoside-diphosphate-sugar epimerase